MKTNNKIYLSLIFLIFSISLVFAVPQYNKLEPTSSLTIEINDSTLNVNNSQYLGGYPESAFARLNAHNIFNGYQQINTSGDNLGLLIKEFISSQKKSFYITTTGISITDDTDGDELYEKEWSIYSFNNDLTLLNSVLDYDGNYQGYFNIYNPTEIRNNLIVSNNITANKFIGDGSLLTGISGGNSSWNETKADSKYLKLDQSTPQTLTSSPIFDSGTTGLIPFFSDTKTLTQSASLYWDIATDRLGINTQTPEYSLDIGYTLIQAQDYQGIYAYDYTTPYTPILEGSITGLYYDGNLGEYMQYYDDGVGGLISAYDYHSVGYVDYPSGYLYSNGEEIYDITYNYTTSPPVARFNGTVLIKELGIGKSPDYPLDVAGDLLVSDANGIGNTAKINMQYTDGSQTDSTIFELISQKNVALSAFSIRNENVGGTHGDMYGGISLFGDGFSASQYRGLFQFYSNAYKGMEFDNRASNANTVFKLLGTGKVGIQAGASISPSAMLHVISTSEQFRSGYSTSQYYSSTTNSTGATIFDSVGTKPDFLFSDNVTISGTNSLIIGNANSNVIIDNLNGVKTNLNITASIYKNASGSAGLTNTFRIVCDVDLVGLTKKYQNFTYSGGILTGNTTCA
jgi:hypothetical protein